MTTIFHLYWSHSPGSPFMNFDEFQWRDQVMRHKLPTNSISGEQNRCNKLPMIIDVQSTHFLSDSTKIRRVPSQNFNRFFLKFEHFRPQTSNICRNSKCCDNILTFGLISPKKKVRWCDGALILKKNRMTLVDLPSKKKQTSDSTEVLYK